TQCTESAANIQSAISSMMSTLEGVSWKGQAAGAFVNARQKVQADTNAIVNRLNAIAEGISKTSSSLMSVDEEAKASLDSVAHGVENDVIKGLRG
ncbi:MAG: WXG100 family type VII secretion target, partial [Micromonosporaceae bacterium]